MKKKILILDDHKIFADSISEMLTSSGFEITGKFYHPQKLLNSNSIEISDLILLDLSLPEIDGFEVIKKLFEINKFLKILVISSHTDSKILSELHKMKVDAYLPKSFGKHKLLVVIEKVLNGERYFAEINIGEDTPKLNLLKKELPVLSEKEKKLVYLIINQATNQEIADEFKLSINTIKYHKKNLYRKLNISSRGELLNLNFDN